MPSSKARAQQVLQASVAVQPQLPLKHYFALLSYLSSLLVANFLFLPRSSSWKRAPLAQRSSADRPEHPFLTPLTSDPIHTMAWHLLGLAVCLAWWSQHLRTWSAGLDSRKPDRKQYRWATAKRLKDSAVAVAASTILLVPVLLALGAPLNSHFVQTSLLAAHLSLLLVWPVIHTYGIPSIYDAGLYDRYRFTRQFCQFNPETPLERALVYPAAGTLFGAWLGALPLPLDWDRPWQSYPLTPTVFSLIGYIAGGYVSLAHSALAS